MTRKAAVTLAEGWETYRAADAPPDAADAARVAFMQGALFAAGKIFRAIEALPFAGVVDRVSGYICEAGTVLTLATEERVDAAK